MGHLCEVIEGLCGGVDAPEGEGGGEGRCWMGMGSAGGRFSVCL